VNSTGAFQLSLYHCKVYSCTVNTEVLNMAFYKSMFRKIRELIATCPVVSELSCYVLRAM